MDTLKTICRKNLVYIIFACVMIVLVCAGISICMGTARKGTERRDEMYETAMENAKLGTFDAVAEENGEAASSLAPGYARLGNVDFKIPDGYAATSDDDGRNDSVVLVKEDAGYKTGGDLFSSMADAGYIISTFMKSEEPISDIDSVKKTLLGNDESLSGAIELNKLKDTGCCSVYSLAITDMDLSTLIIVQSGSCDIYTISSGDEQSSSLIADSITEALQIQRDKTEGHNIDL